MWRLVYRLVMDSLLLALAAAYFYLVYGLGGEVGVPDALQPAMWMLSRPSPQLHQAASALLLVVCAYVTVTRQRDRG